VPISTNLGIVEPSPIQSRLLSCDT
jgi:hypothetical protein